MGWAVRVARMRRQPGDAPVDARHPPAPRKAVDRIVVRAQKAHIRRVGVAAAGVFEDVVGLAFGGGAPASRPGAARAFGLEHAALLGGGVAGAVEIDGAFLGLDEGEKPGAGERAADKVGAGDGGAVGHGEADFGALAAQDLQ